MLKLKVLLAVRRMIKAASFAFFWEMMEKHTHNQLFRYLMDVWKILISKQPCNSMAHELKLLFLWDPIVNTHLHMYCSD